MCANFFWKKASRIAQTPYDCATFCPHWEKKEAIIWDVFE
jgi:hypothetical protein